MSQTTFLSLFSALVVVLFTACGSGNNPPLEVVDQVSLERYAGTWYEIQRLPNSFEKDLQCVSATYTLLENGKIEVKNRGVDVDDPSKVKDIKGSARVPNPEEPAKLKVTFFWPFAGDYHILALDQKDYQYALVGDPSRKFLWILAREKTLAASITDSLKTIAEQRGFAAADMLVVPQNCP